MHRRETAILALVALTGAAFLPVLQAGFVNLDDPALVTANPHVLEGLSLSSLLWAFTSLEAANWHPIAWVSHLIDVSLFGLRAGAHHAMSLALHAVAAVLLLLALERLTGKFWPSLLAAALFAVHPLRVESVAWVAERKDVLAGLFGMLTLLAYLRYVRRPGAGRYLAVLGLLALGLMAKPTLVTMPFVLLLLDWWPLGRFSRCAGSPAAAPGGWWPLFLEKTPLLALSAASAVLTYLAQQRALSAMDLFPLQTRIGNALYSYVAYLGKMAWPRLLIPFYPHPGSSLSTVAVSLSLVVLAGITAAAWASRRRHPWLVVGWLWYLGTLVPMIGLLQAGLQGMADRCTYLPGIGLLLALSSEADSRAMPRSRSRGALGAVSLVVLLVLGILTARQAGHWRDTFTLLNRVIAVDPRNSFAFNMLGANYLAQGDAGRAVPVLVKALELRPGFPEARYNLGLALAETGRKDEALAQFNAAVLLDPGDAEALYNRGLLLLEKGQAENALRDFDAALAVNPTEGQILRARARAHELLGRAP